MNPFKMIPILEQTVNLPRWYIAYVNGDGYSDTILRGHRFETVLCDFKEQNPDSIVLYARIIDERTIYSI